MLIAIVIKKIEKEIYSFLNPIQYARKIGVVIGENCRFINFPDFDSEPYLITIGNHVEISKDVRFVTHDGATWVFRDLPKYKGIVRYGSITVGDNTFIGTRSTILCNVEIGNNCIIGACSLVTKDVPNGEVWGGVPAKFICKTNEFAEKCLFESPKYSAKLLENKKTRILEIRRIADDRRKKRHFNKNPI